MVKDNKSRSRDRMWREIRQCSRRRRYGSRRWVIRHESIWTGQWMLRSASFYSWVRLDILVSLDSLYNCGRGLSRLSLGRNGGPHMSTL